MPTSPSFINEGMTLIKFAIEHNNKGDVYFNILWSDEIKFVLFSNNNTCIVQRNLTMFMFPRTP